MSTFDQKHRSYEDSEDISSGSKKAAAYESSKSSNNTMTYKEFLHTVAADKSTTQNGSNVDRHAHTKGAHYNVYVP